MAVDDAAKHRTKTDAEGWYTLKLPRGLYRLAAFADSLFAVVEEIRVRDADVSLDLALQTPRERPVVHSKQGPVALGELFDEADIVARARIVFGDAESYSSCIYRAMVLTAYKGVTPGDMLTVGPYSGMSIGTEYVLLLKKAAVPPPRVHAGERTALPLDGPYHEIVSRGSGAIVLRHVCLFDAPGGSTGCDDGAKLADYITLPKSINLYEEQGNPLVSWVRRAELLDLLERLKRDRRER